MREGKIKRQGEGKSPEDLNASDFVAPGCASLELNISLGTIDLTEEPNGHCLHLTNSASVFDVKIEDYEVPPFWSAMTRVTRVDHTTLVHLAQFGTTEKDAALC